MVAWLELDRVAEEADGYRDLHLGLCRADFPEFGWTGGFFALNAGQRLVPVFAPQRSP